MSRSVRCFAAILLLPLFGIAATAQGFGCAEGTSCVWETLTPGRYGIDLRGPVDWTVVRAVETTLRKGGKITSMLVKDSPGGDVETALALGRLVRPLEIRATISGSCASACVLAIAGAVHREYYSARLGLHRPYFVTASGSPAEAAQRLKALNESIRRYLQEMDVSANLLDAMNAVPSDQIRWITPKEANELGLYDIDPAYEEYSDGKQAAKLGISRTEYLARKARFREECEPLPSTYPEFCQCVDRIKFRGPGDKWLCDLR